MRMKSRFIFSSLLFLSCAVFLSGCDWIKQQPTTSYHDPEFESFSAEPKMRVMQTSEGTWLEKSNVIAVAEHQGMKTAEMVRIERLETEFLKLRNELQTLMPTMRQIMEQQQALYSDVQALQRVARPAARQQKFQTLQNQTQPVMPGNAGSMPMQAPSNMQPILNQAAPQSGGVMPLENQGGVMPLQQGSNVMPLNNPNAGQAKAVQNAVPAQPTATISQIRFGEHEDRTRIVLDVKGQTDFSYDFQSGNRIMRINLPRATWAAEPQMWLEKSPLVDSYRAIPSPAGGTDVLVQLKRDARVTMAEILPPTSGKGPRLVFDLAAQ